MLVIILTFVTSAFTALGAPSELVNNATAFAQKDDVSPTMDYGVIQSTGKFCPGRDSCRQTRNHR